MWLRAFVLGISLLLGSALPVHAQYSTDQEPVTLIMSPSYPRPYQTVTVVPKSTLIDLSSSIVTITANGAVIKKGSGAQSASITVGGAGETTTIVLSVKAPDGKTYTHTLQVRPADVALVVEPVSSTHPFYKGLPLLAPEARVRLVAVPDVRSAKGSIDPASLVYTWKLGERVLESSSGIGRSVLTATAPVMYRYADVTVTVTSTDSTYVAQAKTSLSPVEPIVRVYAEDPLKGPDFDTAVSGTFVLPTTEATFRAVGYFFDGQPSYAWSVGNKAQGAQRTLTVRSTGSGKGSTPVDIRASTADTGRASANRFVLKFGENTSPLSVFGF